MDVPPISILGGTELFREGLVRVLQKQGFPEVRAFTDMAAMRETTHGPQIILIEPGGEAPITDICQHLRADFKDARIVFLSTAYRTDSLKEVFAAGADGYLVTTMSCDQLAGALRLIALGVEYPPLPLVEALSASRPSGPSHVGGDANVLLSGREMEIVRCLVEGLPNKLISRRLNISDATVKVHVKAVLRKLNLFNRTQVATWALRSGVAPAHGAEQHVSTANGGFMG